MPPERRLPVRSKRKNPGLQTPKTRKRAPKANEAIPDDDSNPISSQVNDLALAPFRILMPGACVYYVPGLIDDAMSKCWYDELFNLSTWYRPTLKVYGKSVIQSRQIAVYAHDPKRAIKYSGTTVELHTDYPLVLSSIQTLVEQKLGVQFNHVMLNRYDSGDVYIGLHADSIENRVIATVTLGAERTFVMRHRTLKGDAGIRKWKLGNGSLFVMQGDTQRFWKHEIPKEPKIKGGRISLTFRQLIS